MINFISFLSPAEAEIMTQDKLADRFAARELYNKHRYLDREPVNVRHLNLQVAFPRGWDKPEYMEGAITWLRKIHRDHDYYEAGVMYVDGSATIFIVKRDEHQTTPIFCALYGESKNEEAYRLDNPLNNP